MKLVLLALMFLKGFLSMFKSGEISTMAALVGCFTVSVLKYFYKESFKGVWRKDRIACQPDHSEDP